MSETVRPPPPPTPRFELESDFVPRLEAAAAPPPPRAGRRLGTIGLVLTGIGVIVVGFGAIALGNFVAGQFARSAAEGYLSLGIGAAGVALLGAAVWHEVRSTWRLDAVDALRARLADPNTRREAAETWLAAMPDHLSLLPAIRAANDPDAIMALLQAGPGADLRARAQSLGRTAALQVFAITAALPHPAFDGLAVAWRAARLLRDIAALHGLRPGLFATLGLVRRTVGAAALVAASNFVADAAVRAAVSNPFVGYVAGDVAGAGVAARRMMMLARAAETACNPLPPL